MGEKVPLRGSSAGETLLDRGKSHANFFFVQQRVSAVLCQAAAPAVPETSSVAEPRVLDTHTNHC